MKKVIIIGGKGTAVVIAEQIKNAILKFNVKLEVLGFAFDFNVRTLDIDFTNVPTWFFRPTLVEIGKELMSCRLSVPEGD